MRLDLYAEHKAEYATPKTPFLLDVGPSTYLSIEGSGKPGGEEFERKIAALYSVAFTIKMASKSEGRDYAVCKLEGLWEGLGEGHWHWRLLIRIPEFIGEEELKTARAELLAKGKPRDVQLVTLERLHEGRCVQMLHVGPYDAEDRTIASMKRFVDEHGLRPHGAHHEIYLSDPRRVAPVRLRTILRQPVRSAGR
jgi:hypothetical protein